MKYINRGVGVLTALVGISISAVNAQERVQTVTSPRPVAEAILRLESIYGIPICYEEPPIVDTALMDNVTPQRGRSEERSAEGRAVLIRRARSIEFKYVDPVALPSWHGDPTQYHQEEDGAISDAVSGILTAYAKTGAAERFHLAKSRNSFVIAPVSSANRDGRSEAVIPILDTKLTIVPGTRTRIDLLNLIFSQILQSRGVHIYLGMFPIGSESTEISGKNVKAEVLLLELMEEMAAEYNDGLSKSEQSAFSWRLLYGINLKGYVFNVHRVAAVHYE